ncbi:MAG: PA2778 family cysteine peptidase, partial [Desulfuromonadaceae bacterium]
PDFQTTRWRQQPAVAIPEVPVYQQERLQCGPAALAMALTWSGKTVLPEALEKEVFTPGRHGSLQFALVGTARRHGRAAYEIRGLDMLLQELHSGHPVIVLENLGLSWVPQWHYSVVVGLDPARESIHLHTGRAQPEQRSLNSFLHTWGRADNWGLLVLPPEQLPTSLDSTQLLQALAGLERSSPQAAAVAYEQVTQTCPDNHQAWIGLGNSRYAAGEYDRAATAFAHACQAEPPAAIACNNLAQVLFEQGAREEARRAVLRALELGGPRRADFMATLQEIDTSP